MSHESINKLSHQAAQLLVEMKTEYHKELRKEIDACDTNGDRVRLVHSLLQSVNGQWQGGAHTPLNLLDTMKREVLTAELQRAIQFLS